MIRDLVKETFECEKFYEISDANIGIVQKYFLYEDENSKQKAEMIYEKENDFYKSIEKFIIENMNAEIIKAYIDIIISNTRYTVLFLQDIKAHIIQKYNYERIKKIEKSVNFN